MWWRRLSRGGLFMSGGEPGLGDACFALAWLTARQPVGDSSRQPTFFLCFAKERRQRKATRIRRPLRGCPVVLGTEGQQITRPRTRPSVLWTPMLGARTNLLDAASGATFRPCAPRRRIRGKANTPGSLRLAWARCARPPSETTRGFASVTCSGPVYGAEERRGWKVAPLAASSKFVRAPSTDRERSLDDVRGRVICWPSSPEHRREPPKGAPDPGRLSFAYFSLATQRKVGRLSGRTPDGLSPNTQAKKEEGGFP